MSCSKHSLCLLTLAALAYGGSAQDAKSAAAVEPLTFIYDVPEATAVPLADQTLAEKNGWACLDEDDSTHRFAGCTVLLNDQLVAVFPKDSLTVDVYSRQTLGLKRCARLQPLGAGTSALKPTALTIKENTRGAVAIEVAFRTLDNRPGQITYELTAGAPFLKTTASGAVTRLRVHAPCRFAVLPDFFADDVLIDAATIPVPRAELPSENFLLHMLPGGDAIVLTVSESREQDVGVTLSETAPRQIVASDIAFGKKPHVWVAVLADQGIWHQRTVALAEADKVLRLDWNMPFAALWRVDWSTVDKVTDSWEMLLQDPQGKYVMQDWFGQDEAAGQRFGEEFGARDWNKPGRQRWNPVLGGFSFPCWVDADRRGYLQPLKTRRYAERGDVFNFAGPAVLYPLDRVRKAPFATPLDKLTVVDLMRMTLGVGPCQYILDLEGQKRNSPGVATCYARDVINAIYKRSDQLREGPAIKEQLVLAVTFIRNVRERIDLYVRFGRELTTYLEEQKRRHPDQAEFLDECLALTKRLDQLFERDREKIRTPAYAEQAAQEFRDKLLLYTEADAYPKCEAQMRIFTSIGGSQDGLVAACRMVVKTLRQRAGIALAVNPAVKEIATEIRARSQTMLRNPTAYEAPRH